MVRKSPTLTGFKLVSVLSVSLCLFAGYAGGSEGSGASSGPTAGFFTGPVVEGLRYSTATLSGETGKGGQFLYQDGEAVSFFIGDVQIGEAIPAKPSITTRDLISGAKLYTRTISASRAISFFTDDLPESEQSAFDRFHNTLSFVYSVDSDSDPVNGVTINEGIHQLFTDVELDFSHTSDGFYYGEDELRFSLAQAFNQSLVTYGDIVKPMRALDYYYADQGIPARFAVKGSTEVDEGADGVIDEVIQAEFEFSSAGEFVRRDGRTFTYDRWGNVTSEIADDKDSDGHPDYIRAFSYDGLGNQLSRTWDVGGDGSIDGYELRTYDDNGNLIRREEQPSSSALNVITQFMFDSRNNLIKAFVDSNGDGTWEETRSYEYDQNDNPLSVVTDSNGDGNADSISLHRYNEAGDCLFYAIDYDADGSPEYVESWEYNADGDLILNRRDSDGDGVLDYRDKRKDDTRANLLSRSRDNDGAARFGNARRQYDSDGYEIVSYEDRDGDGRFDRIERYTPEYTGWRGLYNYDIEFIF